MLTDTIFVYSKYSDPCKNLYQYVEELERFQPVKYLCVDHETSRKIVMSSKIQVKNVPCILNFFESGTVEKYEGEDAFSLVNEYLSKLSDYNPPTNETKRFGEPLRPKQRSGSSRKTENKEIDSDSHDLEFDEPIKSRRDSHLTKSTRSAGSGASIDVLHRSGASRKPIAPRKPITPRKPQVSKTSIEDLDSEEELSEDDVVSSAIPASQAMLTPVNLVIPDREDDPSAPKPSKALSSKSSDLMATALSMQKSRDEEESRSARPPNVIPR
jgi:hypothetical protein